MDATESNRLAPAPTPTAVVDESRLLAALRRGDGAAYEVLVRQQSARLLAVARRILGSDEGNDDLRTAGWQRFHAVGARVASGRTCAVQRLTS